MNVGPLWIRISFDPARGHLSSITNMSPLLELACLETVKLDVRDEMKKQGSAVQAASPTLSRAAIGRRVDAT